VADLVLNVMEVGVAGPSAEFLNEVRVAPNEFEVDRASRPEAVGAEPGQVVAGRLKMVADGGLTDCGNNLPSSDVPSVPRRNSAERGSLREVLLSSESDLAPGGLEDNTIYSETPSPNRGLGSTPRNGCLFICKEPYTRSLVLINTHVCVNRMTRI
jgi:hypothetical protein